MVEMEEKQIERNKVLCIIIHGRQKDKVEKQK